MEEDLKEAEADFEKFNKTADPGAFISGVGRILDRLETTAEHVLPADIAEPVATYLNSVSEILISLGDTWDDFSKGTATNQTVAALNLARVVNKAVAPLLPEDVQKDMDYQKIYEGLDVSLEMLSDTVIKWSYELAKKGVCKQEEVFNEDYKDPDACTHKDNGDALIGYELDTTTYTFVVCLPKEGAKADTGSGGNRKEEGYTAKKRTKKEGAKVKGARYPTCQKQGSHTKQGYVKSLKQTKCFGKCPHGEVKERVNEEKSNPYCLEACPDTKPYKEPGEKECAKDVRAFHEFKAKKSTAGWTLAIELATLASQITTAAIGNEDLQVMTGAVKTVGAIVGAGAIFYVPPCSME